MIGEFKVDKNKIHEFYKQGLISTSLTVGGVWLFFMIIILIGKLDSNAIILSSVITLICLVAIGAWMAKTSENIFEKTYILLDENQIIRKGKGLMTVRIDFGDIGRIVSSKNALIVIRKGIFPAIAYYVDRYRYISNMNIMYIPIMMEDFEQIKSYLKSLK